MWMVIDFVTPVRVRDQILVDKVIVIYYSENIVLPHLTRSQSFFVINDHVMYVTNSVVQ